MTDLERALEWADNQANPHIPGISKVKEAGILANAIRESQERVKALEIDRDHLEAKYEHNGPDCNSGHTHNLPMSLWDCPQCTDKLRERVKKLEAVVEAARVVLDSIDKADEAGILQDHKDHEANIEGCPGCRLDVTSEVLREALSVLEQGSKKENLNV